MNLHITWPIENPDQTLKQLRAEAHNSLQLTLTTHGLTPQGRPTWTFTHGQHPALHVRIPVQEHKQ
ncbi:hypothetical protein [Pseudactinotalea sp. Z1732]|uniref:hypothetical protein n=1 Tax=Micrococcales TaxID=85006 RepID=UPI003C7B8EC3